jgi:hypothetical protein
MNETPRAPTPTASFPGVGASTAESSAAIVALSMDDPEFLERLRAGWVADIELLEKMGQEVIIIRRRFREALQKLDQVIERNKHLEGRNIELESIVLARDASILARDARIAVLEAELAAVISERRT